MKNYDLFVVGSGMAGMSIFRAQPIQEFMLQEMLLILRDYHWPLSVFWKDIQLSEYAFKTIIDKETETVLGAHLIGPSAEETINLFAVFIKTEMRVTEIKKMIFSYPTLVSDISYML